MLLPHPDTVHDIHTAQHQERQRYAAQQRLAEAAQAECPSHGALMLKTRRVVASWLLRLAQRLASEGSAISEPPDLERGLVFPRTGDA